MTDELDPERLRRLLDAAAALPRSIEPGHDAWPQIRARIETGHGRTIAPALAPRARRWVPLAAAAVVLVVVSSEITFLALRGRTAPPMAAVAAPAAAARVVEIYARYDAAAEDLARDLASRRSRLDPATVAVLDSCFAKIDGAIAEARAALQRDPNDAVVGELLSATYHQKLDLLKRAADLPLRRL
jgi:hypothetical protein